MLKTFNNTNNGMLFIPSQKTFKCDNCAKLILPSQPIVEEIMETESIKYQIYDALAIMYVSTFNAGKHYSNNMMANTFGDIKLCSNCGIRMTNFYRAFKQFVGFSETRSRVSQYLRCLMRGHVPNRGKVFSCTKNYFSEDNAEDTGQSTEVVQEQLRINTPDPLQPTSGAQINNANYRDNLSINSGIKMEGHTSSWFELCSQYSSQDPPEPSDCMDFEVKEENPEPYTGSDNEILQNVNTDTQTESSFRDIPETSTVETDEGNTTPTPTNEPGMSTSTNMVDRHISVEEVKVESGNEQVFKTNVEDRPVEEVSTMLGITNSPSAPSVTGKIHMVCPVCGQTESNSRKFIRHLRKLHKIPRKEAELHCKERRRMREAAKDRANGKLAGLKIPCEQCKQTFLCEEMLEIHKLAAHPEGGETASPKTCPECGKTFPSQYVLKTHVYSVHLKLKAFQCTQCDRGFTTRNYLRFHQAAHAGEKILCSVCGKAFAHLNLLKQHERTHGNNPKKRNVAVTCDECGKQVSNKYYLADHKLSHANKRNYVCELCGKGHNTQANLASHLAYHRDVETRPNKCRHCGLGFPTKHSLKSHLLSGAHNLSLEQARADAGISSKTKATS